jgi:hypothetical protein
MSFGLGDQKPQPKPPSSLLGLFFPAAFSLAAVAIRFKMELPEKLETAKHVNEITDRITALRMRWLRHVETQLASQKSRHANALDGYKRSAEAAE